MVKKRGHGRSLLHRPVVIPGREEQAALLACAKDGDVKSRNALIERNMPFLLKIASRFLKSHRYSCHVGIDDLAHAGALGFMHAVRTYSAKKTTGKFTSYAYYWAYHYMQECAHDSLLFKVPWGTLLMVKQGRGRPRTRLAVARFTPLSIRGSFVAYSRELPPDEQAILNEELAILQAPGVSA